MDDDFERFKAIAHGNSVKNKSLENSKVTTHNLYTGQNNGANNSQHQQQTTNQRRLKLQPAATECLPFVPNLLEPGEVKSRRHSSMGISTPTHNSATTQLPSGRSSIDDRSAERQPQQLQQQRFQPVMLGLDERPSIDPSSSSLRLNSANSPRNYTPQPSTQQPLNSRRKSTYRDGNDDDYFYEHPITAAENSRGVVKEAAYRRTNATAVEEEDDPYLQPRNYDDGCGNESLSAQEKVRIPRRGSSRKRGEKQRETTVNFPAFFDKTTAISKKNSAFSAPGTDVADREEMNTDRDSRFAEKKSPQPLLQQRRQEEGDEEEKSSSLLLLQRSSSSSKNKPATKRGSFVGQKTAMSKQSSNQQQIPAIIPRQSASAVDGPKIPPLPSADKSVYGTQQQQHQQQLQQQQQNQQKQQQKQQRKSSNGSGVGNGSDYLKITGSGSNSTAANVRRNSYCVSLNQQNVYNSSTGIVLSSSSSSRNNAASASGTGGAAGKGTVGGGSGVVGGGVGGKGFASGFSYSIKNKSLSPPEQCYPQGFNTGRRNSAITYLSDQPAMASSNKLYPSSSRTSISCRREDSFKRQQLQQQKQQPIKSSATETDESQRQRRTNQLDYAAAAASSNSSGLSTSAATAAAATSNGNPRSKQQTSSSRELTIDDRTDSWTDQRRKSSTNRSLRGASISGGGGGQYHYGGGGGGDNGIMDSPSEMVDSEMMVAPLSGKDYSHLKATAFYRVLVVGSHGVGKTTLSQQLLTSEYLANKEASDLELNRGGEGENNTAVVSLDGEEASVEFTQSGSVDVQLLSEEPLDACILLYAVNDRVSFQLVSAWLAEIRKNSIASRLVLLLVANKQDLVRNRTVTTSEGKKLSSKKRCKYLEVSALLDHNVDQVLMTVIRESRSRRTKCLLLSSSTSSNHHRDLRHHRAVKGVAGSMFRGLAKGSFLGSDNESIAGGENGCKGEDGSGSGSEGGEGGKRRGKGGCFGIAFGSCLKIF